MKVAGWPTPSSSSGFSPVVRHDVRHDRLGDDRVAAPGVHLEGGAWHVAKHDQFTSTPATLGGNASYQRSLPMFVVWGGTSTHDGPGSASAAATALHGRDGTRRPRGLAVFGGGEQSAEYHAETSKEIPVATSTRDESQVVEQDHQRTNSQEYEHEDRDPTGAFLHGNGHGRRVPSGGRWRGAATRVSFFRRHMHFSV